MDYFELTQKRCSYRGKFTSKKISREELDKILETALNAPTGCNSQSTEFVVVDDPELITGIGQIIGSGFITKASALILCIVNAKARPVVNSMSFEIEDCAAAVMSMLLAITELGYASVWIDGQLRRDGIAEKISSLISLPDTKRIQILLPIGEPDASTAQPAKKSAAERVSYNRYSL